MSGENTFDRYVSEALREQSDAERARVQEAAKRQREAQEKVAQREAKEREAERRREQHRARLVTPLEEVWSAEDVALAREFLAYVGTLATTPHAPPGSVEMTREVTTSFLGIFASRTVLRGTGIFGYPIGRSSIYSTKPNIFLCVDGLLRKQALEPQNLDLDLRTGHSAVPLIGRPWSEEVIVDWEDYDEGAGYLGSRPITETRNHFDAHTLAEELQSHALRAAEASRNR